MSLPMRERGLKQAIEDEGKRFIGSLPMRERGLKLLFSQAYVGVPGVAPHAGAWIET